MKFFKIQVVLLLTLHSGCYASWSGNSSFGLGWNNDPQSQDEIQNRLQALQANKAKHQQIDQDYKKEQLGRPAQNFEEISKAYQFFSNASYEPLREGFALMNKNFKEFINANLIKKYWGKFDENGDNLFISHVDEVIGEAENEIVEGMKSSFMQGMIKAIEQNSFVNIQDLKFKYVMKYADRWMKPVVSNWIMMDQPKINISWSIVMYETLFINNSESLFYYAVAKNADVVVSFFIDNIGINVNKSQGSYGLTPLEIVAVFNADKVAELLILAGADINKANKSGITPLFIAVSQNADKVLPILINAGADVNTKVDGRDIKGVTPLSEAMACKKLFSALSVNQDMTEILDRNDRIITMLRNAGAYE